jgi:hypothetical protein
MRTMLALALGLGGCAAGAGGTPEREWPFADAHADCAPWDGAATTILLSEAPVSDSLSGPYLSLSVYRSMSEVGGRTRVDGEQANGMAARLCPGDGPCVPADDGWVDLTAGDSSIIGRYQLRLTDGRSLAGHFSARIRNRRVLCG